MKVLLTAWVPRHINTDDLRITDLRLRIEHACVKRQNSGRPRGAAALLRLYPHQYPWGESCALTVSLLLIAATSDRDGAVRNVISDRTVAVRSRRRPGLHAHLMHIAQFSLYVPLQCMHTYIYSPVMGPPCAPPSAANPLIRVSLVSRTRHNIEFPLKSKHAVRHNQITDHSVRSMGIFTELVLQTPQS